MYWVYIITNKNNTTLYTGVTNNIHRRMHEHRNGCGSTFAARYKLRKLVYLHEADNPYDAIRWEKIIKGWKREKKTKLITDFNPNWRDVLLDPEPGLFEES